MVGHQISGMGSALTARETPFLQTLVTLGYLSVLVFAWGGNYTLVKIALEDGGPLTFSALRFCGAAVVIAGAMLLFGRGRQLLPYRGERMALAVIGFFQISVMTVLTAIAMLWIEAGRTVLIAYSMAVWAMLFSVPLLGERISVRLVFGTALGLGGLVVLTEPWQMSWHEREVILGSTIALLGTIAWALGAVLYRRQVWQSPFWSQVFWQIACGGALTTMAALVLEFDEPLTLSSSFTAILVYNWLLPTSLGFWCWARALSRTSATSAGQFLLLSPVFGVCLGYWVLDEPLSPSLLASAVLIILGAFLSLKASGKVARG